MCTAISYFADGHYFGRNLDLEYSYGESVVITPRRYPFLFRNGLILSDHYAMIGMAYVENGYPLYYDGMNEKGLAMAALAFPRDAVYYDENETLCNLAPYELFPYLLGQCETVRQVRELLPEINLRNLPFSGHLPLTPLHFLIADRTQSLTLETTEKGMAVYKNPVGVLTNSPPFDFQMRYLHLFMGLSEKQIENRLSERLDLQPFSRGMGAIGLPGDLSSTSRFVRAVFTKYHALPGQTEKENLSQFFHILGAVEQQKGCVEVEGKYEYTIYSSCCQPDRGQYHYTTYDDRQIVSAGFSDYDTDAHTLFIASTLPKIQ